MPPPVRTRAVAVGAANEIVSNVGLGGLSPRSVAGSIGAAVTGVQRQISSNELTHAVVAESLPSTPERAGRWLIDLPRPTVASK